MSDGTRIIEERLRQLVALDRNARDIYAAMAKASDDEETWRTRSEDKARVGTGDTKPSRQASDWGIRRVSGDQDSLAIVEIQANRGERTMVLWATDPRQDRCLA